MCIRDRSYTTLRTVGTTLNHVQWRPALWEGVLCCMTSWRCHSRSACHSRCHSWQVGPLISAIPLYCPNRTELNSLNREPNKAHKASAFPIPNLQYPATSRLLILFLQISLSHSHQIPLKLPRTLLSPGALRTTCIGNLVNMEIYTKFIYVLYPKFCLPTDTKIKK